MQPYFFPYVGYFSLIRATDFWVVFDEVQFIRHGWIERNRVLNSADGWQYIKVPLVKASRDTTIKDTKIRVDENWQQTILAQLTCYKRKAPYYSQVIELLNHIFAINHPDITSLNVAAIQGVCAYLDIPFRHEVYSKSGVNVAGQVTAPGEWALYIAKHYGAATYINPYGGEEIFDKQKYRDHGIEIKFLKNNLVPYNQPRTPFEPGLSIVDVLMFNSAKETVNLIDNYQFI